jgi:hypothetical protein
MPSADGSRDDDLEGHGYGETFEENSKLVLHHGHDDHQVR